MAKRTQNNGEPQRKQEQYGTIGLKLIEAMKLREQARVRQVLSAIDRDIELHPERLQPLSPELLERVRELTEGVEVDLDAPIEGDTVI